MQFETDYLIIGAGIVGLTIAAELKKRDPNSRVMVLEKESEIGKHSSGRNSGVMHSGIYYPAGTLKAKVCGDGAKEMVEWCSSRSLPVSKLGKVIVPTQTRMAGQVELLLNRAQANNVEAYKIDERELAKLEPEARTATGEAIWCPNTSVVDPKKILKRLVGELNTSGVELITNADILRTDPEKSSCTLKGSDSPIKYKILINASGLHADSVLRMFGDNTPLRLLPFKGIYWRLSKSANLKINHLIYPVPDLRVPFLGVHTTTTVDGSIYLGPTAVPAFGRENYHGFENVEMGYVSFIIKTLAQQFLLNKDGFRNLVYDEAPRYLKKHFFVAAKSILPNLEISHLEKADKVGIRAQMINTDSKEMVNDFVIKKFENRIHVLNAISPAFTCSIPFARLVVDKIYQEI